MITNHHYNLVQYFKNYIYKKKVTSIFKKAVEMFALTNFPNKRKKPVQIYYKLADLVIWCG